ncbi:MAG: hypothetical protein RTU92_09570 [Candidatus Thorarchaeota archaeon]
MTPDKNLTGLEKKKEQSRARAKTLKDNVTIAKRRREGPSQTPGVKVVGYEFTSTRRESEDSPESEVTAYILRRGGFLVRGEEAAVAEISRKADRSEVAEVYIARIKGLDEKWGLSRKFYQRHGKTVFAHRFEDGTILEYSVESYKGYVSRTYYIVRGQEFHPFAQHNYKKT